MLKESHFSASTLIKPSSVKSGRAPYYARLTQPSVWQEADQKVRSRNEYIALEFARKVQFEMVSCNKLLFYDCVKYVEY